MNKIISIITILFMGLLLVSCKDNDENTIIVAASPKPHSEILKYASGLLKEKGYKLKIKPYNDYIMPNKALTLKQVDANFFQHEPYLQKYNEENNTNIISLAKVHIEPIGIYSKVYASLLDVKQGATVLMSSSKSDHGRLLSLLVSANLITIKDGIDPSIAQLSDIKDNFKNLSIDATHNPPLLTEAYKYNQADLILINSNFALDANLNPGIDAIALESVKDNPFANIIATLEEYKDLPKIKALFEVLISTDVSNWIQNKWDGDIVPFINDYN